MKPTKLYLPVIGIMLAFSAQALAATYDIDPDHSNVTFKIRHLLTKVQGKFTKFKGTFNYEPGKSGEWSANVTIDPSSIDTGTPKRDTHLKSPDFFDVKKFPEMTFVSTGVEGASGSSAKLDGKLKMHGVEKPVTLNVDIGGVEKDPWGNERAGFSATGKVNRKDFGLNWNKALEAGGFLVGDDVEISIDVEGTKKK